MNVFGNQNLQELLEQGEKVPSIDRAVLNEDEEAVYACFRSHVFYPYEDDLALKQSFEVFESLFRPDGIMDRHFADMDPEFRLHLFYDEAGMFSSGRIHAATPVEYSEIDQIRKSLGEQYDRDKMREDYRKVFSFRNDPDKKYYDPETGESSFPKGDQ